MDNQDTEEFLEFLELMNATSNDEQIYPDEFAGRNSVYLSLNFLPCRRYSDTLLFGRVTTPKKHDQSDADLRELRSLFGKISRWIKKNYTDELLFKSHLGEITEHKIKYWLGPNLKGSLSEDTIRLKSSTNSNSEWFLDSGMS